MARKEGRRRGGGRKGKTSEKKGRSVFFLLASETDRLRDKQVELQVDGKTDGFPGSFLLLFFFFRSASILPARAALPSCLDRKERSGERWRVKEPYGKPTKVTASRTGQERTSTCHHGKGKDDQRRRPSTQMRKVKFT
mmetsp:Transcript_39677/g.78144  ORF Transcript_39677/g.78144 Transcript_39677/m.78144 type:complete len:138 (+) Transcript_39677:791-1204(+)